MEYERLCSGGAPSTQGRSERFTSAAYDGGRSQSFRFVARTPAYDLDRFVARTPAYDLDLSHGERLRLGGRAPPEGLPENGLLPPAGDGPRASRSRRFSSMRLFGCGGA
ncbi:unnamed protein product [Urochloa humidicola]